MAEAVRNILESSLRAMSVRAVSSAQDGRASKKLVTELIDSDVAFVGGELLGETLRTTCKAKGQAVPDLELLTGPRVLALDFQKAMDRAKRSCSTTKMILEAQPTSTLGSAADIVPCLGTRAQITQNPQIKKPNGSQERTIPLHVGPGREGFSRESPGR